MGKNKKSGPDISAFPDFATFVGKLADWHHDGTVSKISDRIGVSVATPNFWRRGVVLPNLDALEKLSKAYDLDFDQLRALHRKTQEKRRGK
jgi:transcriptional regulator with XRE-family HTH domain